MDKNHYFMYEIDLIEEQIEDLQIKLEIGKAEEKLYDLTQTICEEYKVEKNQRVEFDYNDFTVYLTIDNTDHDFEFTEEEVNNLKNEDFTEDKFIPYDYLSEWYCMLPSDILKTSDEEIKSLLIDRIKQFFNSGF